MKTTELMSYVYQIPQQLPARATVSRYKHDVAFVNPSNRLTTARCPCHEMPRLRFKRMASTCMTHPLLRAASPLPMGKHTCPAPPFRRESYSGWPCMHAVSEGFNRTYLQLCAQLPHAAGYTFPALNSTGRSAAKRRYGCEAAFGCTSAATRPEALAPSLPQRALAGEHLRDACAACCCPLVPTGREQHSGAPRRRAHHGPPSEHHVGPR